MSDAKLPAGWRRVETLDGQGYFYNASTDESTWERPQSEALSSSLVALRILLKELSTKKETVRNARCLILKKFLGSGWTSEAVAAILDHTRKLKSSRNPERVFRQKLAVIYLVDDLLRKAAGTSSETTLLEGIEPHLEELVGQCALAAGKDIEQSLKLRKVVSMWARSSSVSQDIRSTLLRKVGLASSDAITPSGANAEKLAWPAPKPALPDAPSVKLPPPPPPPPPPPAAAARPHSPHTTNPRNPHRQSSNGGNTIRSNDGLLERSESGNYGSGEERRSEEDGGRSGYDECGVGSREEYRSEGRDSRGLGVDSHGGGGKGRGNDRYHTSDHSRNELPRRSTDAASARRDERVGRHCPADECDERGRTNSRFGHVHGSGSAWKRGNDGDWRGSRDAHWSHDRRSRGRGEGRDDRCGGGQPGSCSDHEFNYRSHRRSHCQVDREQVRERAYGSSFEKGGDRRGDLYGRGSTEEGGGSVRIVEPRGRGGHAGARVGAKPPPAEDAQKDISDSPRGLIVGALGDRSGNAGSGDTAKPPVPESDEELLVFDDSSDDEELKNREGCLKRYRSEDGVAETRVAKWN